MKFGLGWLAGGDDRGLAASQYADRESATDKAAARKRSKTLARRSEEARQADRAGWAWVAAERRVRGG
ncbi:hypothetical protein ACH4Q7_22550 [Streptomyces roseolus]|uniref:hypothetical protein n=1 Tax=Streptomyces roseolus TaxID=67358 RepID=UPI0037BABC47